MLGVVALVAVGCSKGDKKSPCEEARDLHIAAFEKVGRPIAARVDDGEVSKAEPDAEAMRAFEATVARMKERYVKACEEVGADRVVPCVKKLVADGPLETTAECNKTLSALGEKVDGETP